MIYIKYIPSEIFKKYSVTEYKNKNFAFIVKSKKKKEKNTKNLNNFEAMQCLSLKESAFIFSTLHPVKFIM